MEIESTLDTVAPLAERASEFLQSSVVNAESEGAARLRTPLNRIVSIDHLIESEGLPFQEILLSDTRLNIFITQLLPTCGVSAEDVHLVLVYLVINVLL